MPSLPRPALPPLLAATIAAVALVAAGCGGGGGGSSTTVPPSSVPASTTVPPPGPTQLQSIVVQASDLPSGWTAKPAGASVAQSADDAAFDQCMNTPNTTGQIVATAYSPHYVKGTSTIDSAATSYKVPSAVQADTAALTNPKASSCLVQVGKARLATELPAGAVVKTDTVKITAGANGGPANVVATATTTVTFTAHGHTTTLTVDSVFLVAPRIEAHIDFISQGTAIPAPVKAAVIAMVSARVTYGS